MTVGRTALFEGQIYPPSFPSYGFREVKNVFYPNQPEEHATSGFGGVTFRAKVFETSGQYAKVTHNTLEFTLNEIFGGTLTNQDTVTMLFKYSATGSIPLGACILAYEWRPGMWSTMTAPNHFATTKDALDCMIVFNMKNSTMYLTVNGKESGYSAPMLRPDQVFKFLHPPEQLLTYGRAIPPYAYQISARDIVFIKNDGVGISGIQSSFAGLSRYDIKSVEIPGEGMFAQSTFPEQELSRPMDVNVFPVLSTHKSASNDPHIFTLLTANTLPKSIRVDGIGAQLSFKVFEGETQPVTFTCKVSDDLSEIGTMSRTISVDEMNAPANRMQYQFQLGFIDLIKEGIKIKPSQAANIRLEFEVIGNTKQVDIYQAIGYVFGNDYISGFYDDTSLFGTLSSRYTKLKLVEDNDGSEFVLGLPHASVIDNTRNTEITVTAKESGHWSGEAVLHYDRLNMSDFVSDSFSYEGNWTEGATAHSKLSEISKFLGLKVIANDIDNTVFTNGEITIRAATTSRSFIPGTSFQIKTSSPNLDTMFIDSFLSGFRENRPESANNRMLLHINDNLGGNWISDSRGGIATPHNVTPLREGVFSPPYCAVIDGSKAPSYIECTPHDQLMTTRYAHRWEGWISTLGADTRLNGTFLHTVDNNMISLGNTAKAFYSSYSLDYLETVEVNPWPSMTAGKWYHICFIAETGFWGLYINGKLIVKTTSPYARDFAVENKTTSFRIGYHYPVGNAIGKQMNCRLDEFRIYEMASYRLDTFPVPTGPFEN